MIPTVQEVRDWLEQYGIDTTATYSKTGTTAIGSAVITGITSTAGLKKYMAIAGTGIPAGVTIVSVDSGTQITISATATAAGSATLTITYNDILSDEWITNRMTRVVIPYIEALCSISFSSDRTFSEVYSGTGSPLLILNRKNIKSIVQVELLTGTMNTQLNVQSLEILSAEGAVRAKAYVSFGTIAPYFPKGTNNVKVTYTVAMAPDDLKEVAIMLTCELVLGQIQARTGGGSFGAESWSRTFGERGKYTDIRHDLTRQSMAIMRRYMTGVTGA
jgi:hypothetical protein